METHYRIRRADGSVLPGVYTQEQAEEMRLWEGAACTVEALTEAELTAQIAEDLRFALGHEEDTQH